MPIRKEGVRIYLNWAVIYSGGLEGREECKMVNEPIMMSQEDVHKVCF